MKVIHPKVQLWNYGSKAKIIIIIIIIIIFLHFCYFQRSFIALFINCSFLLYFFVNFLLLRQCISFCQRRWWWWSRHIRTLISTWLRPVCHHNLGKVCCRKWRQRKWSDRKSHERKSRDWRHFWSMTDITDRAVIFKNKSWKLTKIMFSCKITIWKLFKLTLWLS